MTALGWTAMAEWWWLVLITLVVLLLMLVTVCCAVGYYQRSRSNTYLGTYAVSRV